MRRISMRVSLVVLTVLMTAGAIFGPVQDANAATSMYGRAEYQEYFSGTYASGSYGCPDRSGRLICGGIPIGEIDGFVNFYWAHLYDGDEQNRVAAAFTILAMLGVNGPDAGGNINVGVQMARDRFGEWDARVRSYAAAGRINFSTNFAYSTNTAYRSRDVLWRNVNSVDESIVFSLADGSHVAIKKACANLVGAAYLPPMPNYNLSASSSVSHTQATPGDRLTWSHSLSNDGPGTTSQTTGTNLGMSGFTAPAAIAAGFASGAGWDTIGAGAGVGVIKSYWAYNLYDVVQDDVGNTLCQWVQYDPTNATGGRHGRSTAACVAIPYNYTLVPEITNITSGNMIESGAGSVPIQGRVTNSGPTKSVPNIQWQITQIRYAPGAALPNSGGGFSGSAPCAYFSGNTACSNPPIASGTEASGYGFPQTVAYPTTGNIGDEPVGTRMCYAMSVNPGSTSVGGWRHSQLYCYVVGKKPKIQVFGGDLIVGRGYNSSGTKISANVITSVSNKAGTYYGSWSEYAIIPSGTITGMASASGYANGTASSSLCNTPLNLLSFSNARTPASPPSAPAACNDTDIGRYSLTSASQFDAIASRFAAASTAPVAAGSVNVSTITPGTIYRGNGTDINLTAAVLDPSRWVVINAPTSNVRITGNIQYTPATLTRVSEIPQLVIIAKNIVIADNVTNVDAWLYAKGTGADGVVNTCDSAIAEPTGLTSNYCSTTLTINGPIVANHLQLNRTAGSGVGAATNVPAEIFRLRPDAYMWASTFSGLGTKARTATTVELPPRF